MEYNDFWLMLCDEGKVRKCAAYVLAVAITARTWKIPVMSDHWTFLPHSLFISI